MAEPGLLARPRSDGHDALFRSQWGGSETTLRAVLAAGGPERALSTADWQPAGRAPRPAWVGDLDCLRTTAVYVLGAVPRAYLPLWAGLPTAGLAADPTAGAPVRVCSAREAHLLRRDWRRLKRGVADAVRAEDLSLPAAVLLLRGVLAARETLAGHSRVDGLL